MPVSKQLWKGTTLLAPLPAVMVSCGTIENPNIITIAWTGIVNTRPPMTYISVQPSRHSYGIIKEAGCFVINLVPEKLIAAMDTCGVRSGRELRKFEAMGLTPEPSSRIAAPGIAECPVSLECAVRRTIPLGSHEMFLAEIVAVAVEEAVLDGRGKLHLERMGLTAFAHGDYYTLGKPNGSFGFSVRKKRPAVRPGARPHPKKREVGR